MRRRRIKRGRTLAALFSGGLIGTVIASCSLTVDPDALNAGCPSGTKLCDQECVSTTDPEVGCGRPGCQPCALQQATAVCSASGECVVGACTGSFENCNGVSSDGCEVNVDTSTTQCGSCNAPPCAPPNAEPDCARGRCAIFRCHTGFDDCDDNPENGCEIDLRSNAAHCGACLEACPAGQSCIDGSCG